MQKIVTALIISIALAIGVGMPAYAASTDLVNQSCRGDAARSELCKEQKLFGPDSVWTRIVNLLIFATGAVATIMIVVGGLRYVLSNGESSGLNSAKDTIIYACVGLVIAILSYGIVNFVLNQF